MLSPPGGGTPVPGVASGTGVGTTYAGFTNINSRFYIVRYSGLDPSASVTIDCNVCVQEQLNAGAAHESFIPFSAPSEAARPGYLQSFLASAGAHRLYDWGVDAASRLAMQAARSAGDLLYHSVTNALRDEL